MINIMIIYAIINATTGVVHRIRFVRLVHRLGILSGGGVLHEIHAILHAISVELALPPEPRDHRLKKTPLSMHLIVHPGTVVERAAGPRETAGRTVESVFVHERASKFKFNH